MMNREEIDKEYSLVYNCSTMYNGSNLLNIIHGNNLNNMSSVEVINGSH